jgi:DNA-3-methyladenine glycosylase
LSPAQALTRAFFERPVIEVARDLVGCTVAHDGCAGVIVETEAYHQSEPACHAWVGRTARTETLFEAPGHAYVYRSYGIHALLNAVCEPEGVGAAVLIRALAPLEGVEAMASRRGAAGALSANGARAGELERLCSGPGKLAEALGVGLELNGSDLLCGPVHFGPRREGEAVPALVSGPRVGISKATELPWRFSLAGSRFVSRPWPAVPRGERGAAGREGRAGG